MQMDRVEHAVKTSGRLVSDGALTQYVRNIVCRLVPTHCDDLRIYVVQTPYFNATMAPNGAMQVWTGLLLRAQNEAQLAYVLGHEAGHYLRRHSVQTWRDARGKTDAMVFFRVLTGLAGVGFVGDIAQLVALGSVFAFSRDNEREADDIGFELMVRAGYDPRQAASMWEGLLAEQVAAKESSPLIFFATHPPTEERVTALKTRAAKAVAEGAGGDLGADRLRAVTGPLRARFLRDEVRLREYARTQVLLDRLLADDAEPAELHFFQGELYRLRNDPGDAEKAVKAYRTALAAGTAPKQVNRSLGLVLMAAGDRAAARAVFERYLQDHPDAEDREMVHRYLQSLEEGR